MSTKEAIYPGGNRITRVAGTALNVREQSRPGAVVYIGISGFLSSQIVSWIISAADWPDCLHT